MASSKIKEYLTTEPSSDSNTSDSPVKMELKGPFWLTRDKVNGELRDKVEVWLVKPDLHRFDDGDVMWLPPQEQVDTETTHFAEWTLEKCRKEVYVVPDTERECIKCG